MRRPELADYLEQPDAYPTIRTRPGLPRGPNATLSPDNRFMLAQALDGQAQVDDGSSPFPWVMRNEPRHISADPNDMGNYADFADYTNHSMGLMPPRQPLAPDVLHQEVGLLPGNGSGVHNDAAVEAGGAGAIQMLPPPPPANADAQALMTAVQQAQSGALISPQAASAHPQIAQQLQYDAATLADRPNQRPAANVAVDAGQQAQLRSRLMQAPGGGLWLQVAKEMGLLSE